ncbi:MAG: hypothetical protein RBR87_07880 [Bacteroidales bacterium]|jgi:hypothetical protein|nr:hypothetical protein [Bacteroidales bacterium]
MPKRRNILLRLLLLLPVFSIAQNFENSFEAKQNQTFWLNTTIVSDSTAYQGDAYNLTTADQEFGFGFQLDSRKILNSHHSIDFKLSGWLRFDQPTNKAFYILTINLGDKLLLWHAFDLKTNFTTANEWFYFSDSLSIPADLLQNSTLKTYLWNPSKITIAADQVSHSFRPARIPDYLPKNITFRDNEGSPKVLAQNRYFELLLFPKSGSLMLADQRGKLLTKNWSVYTALKHKNELKESQSQQWKLRRIKDNGNKKQVVLVSKNALSRNKIRINFDWKNPQLNIELQSRFRKKGHLERQALVVGFEDSLNRVFRKNRHIDSVHFQKAYYLDQQGFLCGEKQRAAGIYPAAKLSSLQFSQQINAAFLNLDYAADHPIIHYPLQDDTSDFYVDQSRQRLKSCSKIRGSFDFLAGFEPAFLPRLMPVPSGFNAAIVFTEHADWTNIRTQRAVNFGHENIINADSAVGGFVFYDIPVTKSVFYNNPDGVTNAAISDSLFLEKHASLNETPNFEDFLLQLHYKGHEICLHTPEQFSTTRRNMKTALEYMHHQFGSPSWIDHGYNNSAKNNRENTVCDGLRKRGKFSVLKHGDKQGVRYFWNPYFEEVSPFAPWHFDGQLMQPYPGFSDAFPERDFAKIPDTDAWLWRTSGTLEVPQQGLWNYYFNNERLSRIIHFNAIHIAHVYPAWAQETKGYWCFDEDGKIVAETGFNQALDRIDSLHQSGQLLPATVQQLLSYHEQVLQIDYQINPDNSISITHKGSQAITGLSFISLAAEVEVLGKTFEHRQTEHGLIFWFNIAPGEEINIRPKKY